MSPPTPETLAERIPTGIPGMDTLLGGGLLRAGIYMVTGRPGAGKTIFANQFCFHHASRGTNAVYVTLLAETHGRMLNQLQSLAFFRREYVGSKVRYLSGFSDIETDGLAGLMRTLRQAVRDDKASVLVIDGMVTAASYAKSEVDYKKFIHELQTWVAMMGCTVLILTSGPNDGTVRPEHTMVDGLVELGVRHLPPRSSRVVRITKFRGSGFLEGDHLYQISGSGLSVYPRCEVAFQSWVDPLHVVSAERAGLGNPGLDRMLGGGLRRGSTALALGSSGCGKTVLGMQFLAEGARRGEKTLHFGFFETPAALIFKGEQLGWPLRAWLESGHQHILWQSPAEGQLDLLAHRLLTAVRDLGIQRLFIDGLVGFKEAAESERMSGYLAVLGEVLTGMNVTTLITEETRQLFVDDVHIPTGGVSAAFHNILFLRQVELDAKLRRLISVMKTRDSIHARDLFEFEIAQGGLDVGAAFSGGNNLMKGEPRGGTTSGQPQVPPPAPRRKPKLLARPRKSGK